MIEHRGEHRDLKAMRRATMAAQDLGQRCRRLVRRWQARRAKARRQVINKDHACPVDLALQRLNQRAAASVQRHGEPTKGLIDAGIF